MAVGAQGANLLEALGQNGRQHLEAANSGHRYVALRHEIPEASQVQRDADIAVPEG